MDRSSSIERQALLAQVTIVLLNSVLIVLVATLRQDAEFASQAAYMFRGPLHCDSEGGSAQLPLIAAILLAVSRIVTRPINDAGERPPHIHGVQRISNPPPRAERSMLGPCLVLLVFPEHLPNQNPAARI